MKYLILPLAACVWLTGCSRDEVSSYEVPREAEPAATVAETQNTSTLPPGHPDISGMGGTSMADTPVPTANSGNIEWTLPETWQDGRVSAMRVGSFKATGPEGEADISVTTFPGDVGGLIGNINRWRGQVGLGPVSEDAVEQFYTALSVAGHEGYLVEAVAPQAASGSEHPVALLSVGVQCSGQSWFFKMTGPAPLVNREKARFLEFVASVQIKH